VAENDLPSLRARAVALNAMRTNADFDPLAAAVRRVVNILKKADEEDLAAGRPLASEGEVSPAYFEKNCEGSLREAVCNTLPSLDSAVAALRFDEVANLLVGLKPGIDRFFDEVMVNADDPLVRQNRLALLGLIRTAFMRFADISRIQTQGA
jgi:glycyl-tRNA synthetase beta chain